MRRLLGPRLLAALAAFLLLVPVAEGAVPTALASPPAAAEYPNVSWAVGVVVPEGSSLQGGGSVHWEDVSNVTASVALPDIETPDGDVYAILSVETSEGVVLQAAAGAVPARSGWLGFGWSVQGASSGSPSYQWILNASGASMDPLSNISISIFREGAVWALRIVDLDTGASVGGSFPSGLGTSLAKGDQEAFALESYTRTQGVFSAMGNLTLSSLLLDDQRVVGGCYTYAEWDPIHNPLFVVGSSGSSPPSFIYVGETSSGSFFWDYSGVWVPLESSPLGAVEVILAAALIGSAVLATVGFVLNRRTAERERGPRPGPRAPS